MNKKQRDYFMSICQMTQKELKSHIADELRGRGFSVLSRKGFLYSAGDIPIMLTAHLDTVHTDTPATIITRKLKDGYKITSPQGIGGDDRCGVWIILDILRRGYRPHVLFCEDEEVGGIGSNKYATYIETRTRPAVKYVIELDRKGKNDAVYYSLDNPNFEDYIIRVTGYKTDIGSFSDICHICPALGVAGVNMSVGYYRAHTPKEYVKTAEMTRTRDAVALLLRDAENIEQFEYKELPRTYYGGYCGGYYDSYYGAGYDSFEFVIECGDDFEIIPADSYEAAIGAYLMNHPTARYCDIHECYIIN